MTDDTLKNENEKIMKKNKKNEKNVY